MKLSILIPVYNVKDCLRETVASLSGLPEDWEIILIDDGSTDGSGALCDVLAWEDPRITVIHQKNKGLSEARNAGIRRSSGEFLCFLDGDDLLDLAETKRLLRFLTPGTEVLLGCYCDFDPISGSLTPENCGRVLRRLGELPVEAFLKGVPPDGRAYYMIACRFVIRREFLLRHGLFFCPGLYHEDEEWTARVLCAADRVWVTDCFFYRYRRGRPGAITARVTPRHLRDCAAIIDKFRELKGKLPPNSEKAQYISRRMGNLYLNILVNLKVLQGEDRGAMLRQLEQLRPCCAPHMSGIIGRTVRISLRILGIKATCALLGMLK